MFSFYLYVLILVFSTVLVWMSEHCKNEIYKKFLLFTSFLIVFVPSAIRYGVGTDFFNYYDIFHYQDIVRNNEYGFYFINYIIHSFGLSAQWAIASYALIFTAIGYISYPKKKAWIFHLLFLSMLLFFSFNGIRQALSIAFVMLAIKYDMKNKKLFFWLLLFLASTFHQSVLFLLPAVIFSRLPLNSIVKEKLFPLFIASVTVLIWVGPPFLELLHKIAFQLNLPYKHYFESSYFQRVNVNTGYLVLLKVLLALILLFNSSKVLRISKENWPIVVYSGVFIVLYSLSTQSAAFGRLSYVFIPGIIYFLYLYLSDFLKKSYIWFALMVCVFIAYLLPYITTSISTIDNPNSDNFYQTIFNKNY